jgi:hypothetical protein
VAELWAELCAGSEWDEKLSPLKAIFEMTRRRVKKRKCPGNLR